MVGEKGRQLRGCQRSPLVARRHYQRQRREHGGDRLRSGARRATTGHWRFLPLGLGCRGAADSSPKETADRGHTCRVSVTHLSEEGPLMRATFRLRVPRLGFGRRTLALFAAATLIAACAGVVVDGNGDRDGKHKKTASGLSLKKRASAETTPVASAVAGFDSERVWSGFDDWEPAIAADTSSSWVYQMTARDKGPQARPP